MHFDLIVGKGTLVTPSDQVAADLGIIAGRIAAVASPRTLARENGREWVDAAGLMVLPGLIDAHVHLYDPGWPEWEDFTSGTRAAAASGISTIIEMPNSLPPVDNADVMCARLKTVEPKAVVGFAMYGGLGETNPGVSSGVRGARRVRARSRRCRRPACTVVRRRSPAARG